MRKIKQDGLSLDFVYRQLGLPKSIREASPVRDAMGRIAKKMMNKYVPWETEKLRNTAKARSGYVTYTQPYARFQYHGNVMYDPLTGSTWAKRGGKKVLTKGAPLTGPGAYRKYTKKRGDLKVTVGNRRIHYWASGTGSFWDKRMLAAEKDKFRAEIVKFIKNSKRTQGYTVVQYLK